MSNGPPSGRPLLVILGPTGSGKTALALTLAARLNAEIISCDSVAVYREFNIGTAKPSAEERSAIPHHLIDIASPLEVFTAGDYARRARRVLADLASRDTLPIIAGGTGLYLRALLEGLFPGPERSEEIRHRLRGIATEKGTAHLHKVLRRLDRSAAARIHANDTPKIIRAIEVHILLGSSISEAHGLGRDPLTGYHIVRIGLDPPRQQLYERINRRCEAMFHNGLVEETQALLARHGHIELLKVPSSPLNALGYRQAVQHLRGEFTREQAIAAAQQAHRNYAKRQMTWFRREPGVHWLNSFGDAPAAAAEALRVLKL